MSTRYEDSNEIKDGAHQDTEGVGLEWESYGSKYVTVAEPPREVRLKITTWAGTDPNAQHYYGQLETSNVESKCIETEDKYSKVGQISSISCNQLPEESGYITIRLTRKLYKVEKRFSMFDDHATLGKVGEYTEAFCTKEDVKATAIREFKRIFTGDWVLTIGYSDEVIARTKEPDTGPTEIDHDMLRRDAEYIDDLEDVQR
jgi:hypothetical protein